MLHADRSLVAWEWLRRDPNYVEAALAAAGADGRRSEASRFGLAAFEPPHLAVPDARPLWTSETSPFVLRVEPLGSAAPADAFDPERLASLMTLVVTQDQEHLLLSDGFRTVRLDGPRRSFTNGRCRLGYAIDGIASAQAPLMTLRRLLALCRTGRFAASLHRGEPRARRWIVLLRACDALEAGADQRDIAQELLSRSVAEPGWRSREPSVRSQAQRLARSARAYAAGEYRGLLGCAP